MISAMPCVVLNVGVFNQSMVTLTVIFSKESHE